MRVHAPKIEVAVICAVAACGSAALIGRSIIVIYHNYYIPLFWDQWDYFREIIDADWLAEELYGLFQRQNEHVICDQ